MDDRHRVHPRPERLLALGRPPVPGVAQVLAFTDRQRPKTSSDLRRYVAYMFLMED
jgi:hypothetical protein